jgi:glycosyltransferase involved in cell wall biosynthesis
MTTLAAVEVKPQRVERRTSPLMFGDDVIDLREPRPSGQRCSRPPRPSISVVVPTLNEASNLPHVFQSLALRYEVIVVDGRSQDDTIRVAQQLRPDVRIIRETAKGKGAALQAGFAAARGDIIVMLDADGSADGTEIPRFVRALLDGADFAKGSRFAEGGGSDDITVIRRIGNLMLSGTVNILFGTSYSDLCYGYNAFWRDCLPAIDVDCPGFEVETLINIRVARADLRVAEIPSYEFHRIHGASNLHAVRDGIRVLRTILAERLSFRRRRPGHAAPWPIASTPEAALEEVGDVVHGGALV